MTTLETTINRSRELQTFYTDVLTTAIESGYYGVGYWAEVLSYRWYSTTLTGGTDTPSGNGGDNAHATIVESEDPAAGSRQLTPDTIAHAFTALSRGPVVGLHETRRRLYLDARRELDAGDIDSDAADNIVQVGIFGEVIYG